MGFGTDFIWGAATASYQIEGAAFEDGKGASIWDMFCRRPEVVFEGHTGNIACDHYHRYKDDVALFRQIGLKAYRFSISWPRVIPDGTGKVNEKGLVFYDRLIDELLAVGIEPYLTLFHWDYPYSLYLRGGWMNPESSKWFEDYTKIVVERYSDRVKNWFTLNEPQIFIGIGHSVGRHAPGDKYGMKLVLNAGHNCLLAHGKAVRTLRQYSRTKANIGYAPVAVTNIPYEQTDTDISAAKEATFNISHANKGMNLTWWTDPVFKGYYPPDGLEVHGFDAPDYTEQDMRIISEPVDFCGFNIYAAQPVTRDKDGKVVDANQGDGYPMSSMPWRLTPECMYWVPKFIYERYGKPIYIAENGMANNDWISLDGKVHDHQRIDNTHRYLHQLKRAAEDGVDVGAYFHWSAMDNFEWALGYSRRFGLIYVDYKNQQRVVKDSAIWYSNIIDNNGRCL